MKHSMIRCLVLLGLLVPALAGSPLIQRTAQDTILKSPPNVAPLKPNITAVNLKYYNGSFIALEIVGFGLGTVSPTKKLYIDGIKADEMEVVEWTNTKIDVDEEVFFEITKDLIYWDHTYQWSIRDGNAVISNTFSKRFPLHMESVTPANAAVGAIIEIVGDGLSHAGDLKIGQTTVTDVLSKEDNKIRARVPAMPGGTYAVSIRQGATTISDTINISIYARAK